MKRRNPRSDIAALLCRLLRNLIWISGVSPWLEFYAREIPVFIFNLPED
ncbi:MAG: hypothetical protein MRK00_05995 [Nitrosomonas sp.]|nr:hypothetical protein [Nitrosomonas sp.]